MADNTYTGADDGAWETGGNWSLGHKPTNAERAVISGTGPVAPVGAETVQDISITNKSLDAHLTLTISRNVTASSATDGLYLKQQTGAGTIALTNSHFKAVSGCAGTVTVDETSVLQATTFAGTVTFTSTGTDAQCDATCVFNGLADFTACTHYTHHASATFNAEMRVGGKEEGFVGPVLGASSTLKFLAGKTAYVKSINTAAAIVALDNLAMVDDGDGLTLAGATITASAQVLIFNPTPTGSTSNINGLTVTGPSTTGVQFTYIGTTGTPIITGFEPLYKVGGGATQSAYGSSAPIIVPLAANLRQGFQAGNPDAPIDGGATFTNAHGGMGLGF
jgi:hypothetical protein